MILINVMTHILGITALSKALDCNLTQPTAAEQCFGAHGRPLIFHLPSNTTIKIRLRKEDKIILMLNGNELINASDICKDIQIFPKNGTFKIDTVTTADSGDYKLEIHSSASGATLKTVKIHLDILEPVSEPAVSQTCLSPEQMEVSCSAEGERAQLTLSLDNNILLQTRVESTEKLNVSDVSIILHGQLVGKLVCKVQNNVSNEQTFIQLTSCAALSPLLSLVTVAVIASVVSPLLLLAVFLGIKHFKSRRSTTTVKEGDAEDDVLYSDVRVTTAAHQLHG